MPSYGTLNRAKVIAADAATGGYYLEVVALAAGRRWGPVPSMVPGLEPGDRVVIGQMGTTRDDVVILGRIPAAFPDVADIPGLQAALDGKVDDAELPPIIDDVAALRTDVDGQFATLTDHETRLDSAETTISGHTTELAAHETRLDALDTHDWMMGDDRELYGDVISTFPRHAGAAVVQIPVGTMVGTRLYLRRTGSTVSQIRLCVAGTLAAGAGTMTCALYVGTTTNNLILSTTNGVDASTLGTKEVAIGPVTLPDGYVHALLAVRSATGYTTAPSLMCAPSESRLLNPPSSPIVAFSKSASSWPTTINLSDGTWSGANFKLWSAMA